MYIINTISFLISSCVLFFCLTYFLLYFFKKYTILSKIKFLDKDNDLFSLILILILSLMMVSCTFFVDDTNLELTPTSVITIVFGSTLIVGYSIIGVYKLFSKIRSYIKIS